MACEICGGIFGHKRWCKEVVTSFIGEAKPEPPPPATPTEPIQNPLGHDNETACCHNGVTRGAKGCTWPLCVQ
jgi:hypothetical protein